MLYGNTVMLSTEGDNKKEREQELKTMMKRLEAKYAALQVVPVISKLGTQRVRRLSLPLSLLPHLHLAVNSIKDPRLL